jgi:streptogramin lyase
MAKSKTAVIVLLVPLILISGLSIAHSDSNTGFVTPYSGTPEYEYLSAPETASASQLSQPIGQELADQIATAMNFNKSDSLTNLQYIEFVSGGGVNGDPVKAVLLGQAVNLFINNDGFPLYSNVDGVVTTSVLSSLGLMVNPSGSLESLANSESPAKQVNQDLAPGSAGYMGTWCRDNGCQSSIDALYQTPYTSEVVLGAISQDLSVPVQLVTNTKNGSSVKVGMSMTPSIWLVNFILLYVLNPKLAALMPSHWEPIPASVANALKLYGGQVPFSQFASELPSYESLLSIFAGKEVRGSGPPPAGPALQAELNQPKSVAVDAAGNVYIADAGNNVIEKVTPDGNLSVIAGGGALTPSTVAGPATLVALNGPSGVAVDAAGNVYIADTGNNFVEIVTPDGNLKVIAGGGGTLPSTTSGPATSALLNGPRGVAVDTAGNVYIADTGNNFVEVVDFVSGHISLLAGGGGTTPQASQASNDWDGHFGLGTNIALNGPRGVAVDASGIVYIADTGNNVIERVTSSILSVVAGGGTASPSPLGPATHKLLNAPNGVAVVPSGTLYIADTNHDVVERVQGIMTARARQLRFTG